MASDREDFTLCGPSHLTDLDWANENHQRCVAACLVQGIYIVERDRQLQRQGTSQALASPWWDSFHFKLIRHLIDDADFSIFGAIYELKLDSTTITTNLDSNSKPPRYVIAFRGTLTKPDSISRDLELDIHIIRNGLHRTSRFEIAMQAVKSMSTSVGASNLWITGHSMGAAMALLAGKTLAKTGVYVKSFLFNPPFVSPPIERIANERVRSGIRFAGSLVTAGLAFSRTLKQAQQQPQHQQVQERNVSDQDPLKALSLWLPDIHVNPGDHLCCEYIGFFEHRGNMEQLGYGAGIVERMAMQHSLGGLLMDAMGVSNAVDVQEPVHVIPSAKLVVNRTASEDYKEAHGIHQWWRDDQDLVSNVYLFK
ncbi:Fungal lipase-like domain-containing protein [Hirschfeldia incana]|nr:Fungal lipase-like domain-containing protein [Hirschfeldia incana]